MAAGDVYQEGLIFPPSRYNVNRDWNGGPFERLVRANVRVPEKTIGDCNAQFAANAVGARRVNELCEKFGADAVTEAMAGLLDYVEQRMRAAIAAAPDGVYTGEDQLDSDGVGDEPLEVRARVEIAGDTVSVDYEGTCNQARTNVNCPFASTIAAGLSCIKSVLTSPDIPFNEGAKRPIAITAPYGSLLNPTPAGAGARAHAVRLPCLQRSDEGAGGRGARAGDGGGLRYHACHLPLAPGRRRATESIWRFSAAATARARWATAATRWTVRCRTARTSPSKPSTWSTRSFRVAEYALVAGSGGKGEWRGGLGIRRVYEVLADDVEYQSYSDRFTIPPEGSLRRR